MPAGTNNLLVRLRKWVHRQDENFLTEAFVHLFEHLLAYSPKAGTSLLRRVTGDLICLEPAKTGLAHVSTQVTLADGRPDIRIDAPDCVVLIELKVESELHNKQLRRYRLALNESRCGKKGLIFLSRYPRSSGP
jgi:hypothetical protein